MSKLVWHLIDPSMPRVKQCPHGPSPNPTPQPPPPLGSDSEPDYGDPDETCLLASIPESEVTLKSPPPPQKKQRTAAVAAAVAISEELAEEKKPDPVKRHRRFGSMSSSGAEMVRPPFIKGQIGKIFLTTKPVNNLGTMPDGTSLIISSWRKALSTEQGGRFVLTDPFGGLWYAPQVFELWRESVEGGAMADISLEEDRLVLVRDGPFFSLCSSKRKQSFRDVLHPIGGNTDKL